MFAFVLGIALSMASTRLEARRDSVLNEANAIGTVWLRASLVGAPEGLAQLRGFASRARPNPLISLSRTHKGLHYIEACAALILGGG